MILLECGVFFIERRVVGVRGQTLSELTLYTIPVTVITQNEFGIGEEV